MKVRSNPFNMFSFSALSLIGLIIAALGNASTLAAGQQSFSSSNIDDLMTVGEFIPILSYTQRDSSRAFKGRILSRGRRDLDNPSCQNGNVTLKDVVDMTCQMASLFDAQDWWTIEKCAALAKRPPELPSLVEATQQCAKDAFGINGYHRYQKICNAWEKLSDPYTGMVNQFKSCLVSWIQDHTIQLLMHHLLRGRVTGNPYIDAEAFQQCVEEGRLHTVMTSLLLDRLLNYFTITARLSVPQTVPQRVPVRGGCTLCQRCSMRQFLGGRCRHG